MPACSSEQGGSQDEVVLWHRKQTETFPMPAKKFELKTLTREEWLATDKQSLEDQLEMLDKEYPLVLHTDARRTFFNCATYEDRKSDGPSYKPSHWFRHFCSNRKGGKRND
jgi:hypothetical protein